MATPQWKQLVDHVMAVPEKIYETWTSSEGWNNITVFGAEFGEQGVSWCVIFDWDMYHDVGLDTIVPRTDNVTNFSDWAQQHGQWSEYPSAGAWVNLGDGAHTEIVVGFDQDTVYTKGGNSIQAGSTDSGQGNGVWSHATPRRSTRVTGYFAPHYPDGICPPTADPSDPRGGKAITSYSWPGPSTPTPTPQEDDMTPAQEAKLDRVLALLAGPGNMAYRNADQDAASVKAGKGHIPDVYAYIQRTDGNAAATQALVAALQTNGLTDVQIAAIADKVAAAPSLSDAIAAKVAANIAARLES